MRRTTALQALVERFCRPHRVGLFGHRGVGKTTLLTVLYREAVGGRLPELRLAAADVPTADYLSDKVVQLEAGQPLPATLAETDLRFHLYHQQNRIDLVLRDYQGEHIELGRDGSIQEFLRECDAVWLCLDLGTVPEAAARLRRQQEIEHLMEDYLKCEARPTLERPIALVLTKADLLGAPPANLDELAQEHFGMTRHALASHCPQNGLFAVSSLAPLAQAKQAISASPQDSQREGEAPAEPQTFPDSRLGRSLALPAAVCSDPEGNPPTNEVAPRTGELNPWDQLLAAPLAWLARALQALDESRLERLWTMAGNNVALLDRCVGVFARRYPDAPATRTFQQRLREMKRQRRRRRMLVGLAAVACLIGEIWTYDAIGHEEAQRFAAAHEADPAAVLDNWQRYESWHPTRRVWQQMTAEQEEDRRRELAQRIRDQERDQRLSALRREAADPDADPAAAWQRFQAFRAAHPEVNIEGDLEQLRTVIKARRDAHYNAQARRALDELLRAAQRADDLPAVVQLADKFLADYAGSACEGEGRRCREAVLRRLDEQDIQAARAYSARNPLNFQTRREHYQRYLDKHPTGGAFTKEAEEALRAIALEWDKHDFRAVRDHYLKEPGNIVVLASHCRRYLAVHPGGKFKASATELLRWTERVSAPGEYKVVLRNGQFDKSVGRWFTRGPKLSVELEVGGIRYGPSTICYNRYDPEWDFEYPRRIRWKLGESVLIRVTDHNWSNKVVMEVSADPGDPLALRLLTGEVHSGGHRVKFTSDFALPVLPKIE